MPTAAQSPNPLSGGQPSPARASLTSGRLLARNTAINLAGRVAPLLVAVAAMPYVIRHLGPDRFGLLSLAWIVVGYFALFDLGIGPATTKFVAEYLGRGEHEKLPELVWTAVISQTCLGIVAGLLLAAATPLLVNRLLRIPPELQSQAHLVFLILAFSLPLTLATGSLGGVLAASQRFDLLNAVGVPSSALNYLLPVVALALGYGLPAIVLSLVVGRAVTLLVSFLLCRKLYPALTRTIAFNRRLVRPILGFGGWVTVSGVVSPILVYFDRFLIGSLLSVGAIGFYTPPYMISSKLALLPESLATTLFPAFATSAGRGDNEWIGRTFLRSLKYLLLLAGPASLVLIFYARPLLTVWVGPRFAAEGASVLQILAVGVLANSLAFVPYNLLQGIGRPDLTAKFHLIELPIHIGLAWFLVARYGLPGAALAWTARVSFDLFLLVLAACRLTRTHARTLFRTGLPRAAVFVTSLALALWALWLVTHAVVADVLVALPLGAGFLAVAWLYALDVDERCQIRLWLAAVR